MFSNSIRIRFLASLLMGFSPSVFTVPAILILPERSTPPPFAAVVLGNP